MQLILAMILLISSSAFAQPIVQKSKTQLKKSSPLAKIESPWTFVVDYSASTNMADERSNKTFEHTFDTEIDYSLGRFAAGELGLSVGTGFIAYADGNNVRNEQSNPQWNDVAVGLSYGQKTFADSKIILALSENLPTGYESQSESYKSVVEAGATLATPFFSKSLTLLNVVGGSYIFNTYSESPNSLASNPNFVTVYKLGLNYAIVSGFSLGVIGTLKSVHFMNNENQLRSSTAEYVQYKSSNWSVSLSYLLGNYDQNDTYRFLYLDEDRRIFKLGVKFEI